MQGYPRVSAPVHARTGTFVRLCAMENFGLAYLRKSPLAVLVGWAPQGRSGETLIVYYDFACMLEKYCLARDPWLFRNVIFMIDKFHLKNHTCSSSFSYYEYDACMLARTQVAEQGSSVIDPSSTHLFTLPPLSFSATCVCSVFADAARPGDDNHVRNRGPFPPANDARRRRILARASVRAGFAQPPSWVGPPRSRLCCYMR